MRTSVFAVAWMLRSHVSNRLDYRVGARVTQRQKYPDMNKNPVKRQTPKVI